ncbi:MAG: NRDE family protein [Thermoanaerobaculia bacterium]
MCLLVAIHRVHPDAPLLVAANRDELLARPATAMTVLRDRGPRVLGGRDEVAGGTWLAVNEYGLVAALTNRPSKARNPAKRSRGEWPVFLASFTSPFEAATALVDRFDPADFNPGWVLVGNADELVYVDMTADGCGRLAELDPGIHILENRPLEAVSSKVDLVRIRLEAIDDTRSEALIDRLQKLLASHRTPAASSRPAGADPLQRSAAAEAACVHLGEYGTRSATIVRVDRKEEPRVWSADGRPCTHPFVEVSGLWQASGVGVASV